MMRTTADTIAAGATSFEMERKNGMGLDTFSKQCAEVAAQFRLQAASLDLEIIRAKSHYKYEVKDVRTGAILRARCLPTSWSLYEQHLFHAVPQQADLLIVQAHNAAVPVPVVSLDTGHYYRPATIPPAARVAARRRNTQEKHLLISLLALGLDAGGEALRAMSRRSQQRYQALLASYLRPSRGRARTL
jgi:hypothetical protein